MSLYEEIAREIRQSITAGVYEVGDRLPSIRSVSKRKPASINTVVRAYGLLEQAGWVSASSRSGYYVLDRRDSCEKLCRAAQPWAGHFEDLMPELLQQSSNENVLNLGVLQPECSLAPSQTIAKSIRRTLRQEGSGVFDYCDARGVIDLRVQIARIHAGTGLAVDPDDIVVTNGCQEALQVAFRSVARAGDTVAVESPCYCGALQLLSSLGMKILEIPTARNEGMDLDYLEQAVQRHEIAACYVTPTLSNPSGDTMSRYSKIRLCDMASRSGFYIVEDHTNAALSHSEEGRRSLRSYSDSGNVVLCSSFSKSLSPGLRTGWLVTANTPYESSDIKCGNSLNVSKLNQLAISNIVSSGKYRRHIEKTRPIHAQTLRSLRSTILQSFPKGTKVSTPNGGYCAWVELPVRIDAAQLAKTCHERGVVFAPGRMFGVNFDYRHCVRLSWGGVWSKAVAEGVRVVGSMSHQL